MTMRNNAMWQRKTLPVFVRLVLAMVYCGGPSIAQTLDGGSERLMKSKDSAFLLKAAQGGQGEVRLGELAAQKGDSEDVRAFGRRMANEHARMNSPLSNMAA